VAVKPEVNQASETPFPVPRRNPQELSMDKKITRTKVTWKARRLPNIKNFSQKKPAPLDGNFFIHFQYLSFINPAVDALASGTNFTKLFITMRNLSTSLLS
jgi:hypothetical protein